MTIESRMLPMRAVRSVPEHRRGSALPAARSVLAVVARPGDESGYLGAVLDAFRSRGGAVSVLCFTRGESSPYNESLERPTSIRRFEFEVATFVLRAEHRLLADYPDTGLSRVPVEELAERVVRMVGESRADMILTVDGRLGDPSAAGAASLAGLRLDLPVLGWTLPPALARAVREVSGPPMTGDVDRCVDFDVRVDRRVQRCAIRAHHSQSPGDPAVLARLAIQGEHEWLRWLVPPSRDGSRG